MDTVGVVHCTLFHCPTCPLVMISSFLFIIASSQHQREGLTDTLVVVHYALFHYPSSAPAPFDVMSFALEFKMMVGEMNKPTFTSYIPHFSSGIHPLCQWISSLFCHFLCYDVAWAWDGRDGSLVRKWTFICLYTFSVEYHPLIMLPWFFIIMHPTVSLSTLDLTAVVLFTFSSVTFTRNLFIQNDTSLGSMRESFGLQGSLRRPHIFSTLAFASRFFLGLTSFSSHEYAIVITASHWHVLSLWTFLYLHWKEWKVDAVLSF